MGIHTNFFIFFSNLIFFFFSDQKSRNWDVFAKRLGTKLKKFLDNRSKRFANKTQIFLDKRDLQKLEKNLKKFTCIQTN